MIHYRYLEAERKRKKRQLSSEDVSAAGRPTTKSVLQERPHSTHGETSSARASISVGWDEQKPQAPELSSLALESGEPQQLDAIDAQHYALDGHLPVRISHYSTATGARSRNAVISRVTDYEDTDSHEELVTRMFVERLDGHHHTGDGDDPFLVLPQFQNPELDATYLMRNGRSPKAFIIW